MQGPLFQLTFWLFIVAEAHMTLEIRVWQSECEMKQSQLNTIIYLFFSLLHSVFFVLVHATSKWNWVLFFQASVWKISIILRATSSCSGSGIKVTIYFSCREYNLTYSWSISTALLLWNHSESKGKNVKVDVNTGFRKRKINSKLELLT